MSKKAKRPALKIPANTPFICVMRNALQVARDSKMDINVMLKDVQGRPTIEERYERLNHYFEVS